MAAAVDRLMAVSVLSNSQFGVNSCILIDVPALMRGVLARCAYVTVAAALSNLYVMLPDEGGGDLAVVMFLFERRIDR